MTDGPHDDRPRRSSDRLLLTVRLLAVLPALVVLVVVALVVGWPVGLLAGLVAAGIGLASVELARRGALDRALASLGPSATAGTGDPSRTRWENVVDGLSKGTGVDSPEFRYLPDATVNAAVLVADGRTVLVATEGLADSLSQVELEAVAANLLGRARDDTASLATLAVGILGPRFAAAPWVARILVDGLGEQYDVRSDLEAARLTRYPPGVLRALQVVEERGSLVAGAHAGSAPLWLAPVVESGLVPPTVAATAMQPVALRSAVVAEL